MKSEPFTTAGGIRAALPICLAYLPVAFALGFAASGAGLTPWAAGAMSALMFSGANQAFFLSSIGSSVPMLAIIALCGAVNLRHLLYGMVIKDRIATGTVARAIFAFGLTDEVFATVLSSSAPQDRRPGSRWLLAVVLSTWFTWIVGTYAGAAIGDRLQAADPAAAKAMGFALPALFIGLVWQTLRRELVGPMLLAGLTSAIMVWMGWSQWAIPAAGLAALSATKAGRT